METKISITQEIADGLNEVRESGVTNMFAREVVLWELHSRGFDAAVVWVRENPKSYAHLVMWGYLLAEKSSLDSDL